MPTSFLSCAACAGPPRLLLFNFFKKILLPIPFFDFFFFFFLHVYLSRSREDLREKLGDKFFKRFHAIPTSVSLEKGAKALLSVCACECVEREIMDSRV